MSSSPLPTITVHENGSSTKIPTCSPEATEILYKVFSRYLFYTEPLARHFYRLNEPPLLPLPRSLLSALPRLEKELLSALPFLHNYLSYLLTPSLFQEIRQTLTARSTSSSPPIHISCICFSDAASTPEFYPFGNDALFWWVAFSPSYHNDFARRLLNVLLQLYPHHLLFPSPPPSSPCPPYPSRCPHHYPRSCCQPPELSLTTFLRRSRLQARALSQILPKGKFDDLARHIMIFTGII